MRLQNFFGRFRSCKIFGQASPVPTRCRLSSSIAPDVRVGKDEIRLKICRSQELTAGANKCADKKSVKLAPLPFKDLMAVFLHLR